MTSQSKIFRAACVALVIVSACNSNDDRSRPEQVLPKDAVFYFDDLSGTVVSTADHVGLPHGATTRYPYGEVRHSSGRPEPFGFAGREADASGLFDFSVRAYRPETSLFLSPDPLALFKSDEIIGSPGRASAYAYSSSDPVNFVDPSGRSPESVQDNMTRQLQNLQREIAQSDNFTGNATSASKPADSFDRAVERYRDALRESGNLSSEHGVRVVLGVEERLKNERLEEQQARSEGRMTAEWAREINAENTQRAWDEQRSFPLIPTMLRSSASSTSSAGPGRTSVVTSSNSRDHRRRRHPMTPQGVACESSRVRECEHLQIGDPMWSALIGPQMAHLTGPIPRDSEQYSLA